MKHKLDLQGYDSKEELYFTWWLDDAKKAGLVESWHSHPKQFDLTRGFYYNYIGKSTKQYTLARPHTYTPDFLICWNNENAKRLFKKLYGNYGIFETLADEKKNFFYAQKLPYEFSSYIDIKPKFTKQDSQVAIFSLKRALMLQLHNTHVQAVIPQHLFEHTFTPLRYLRTDGDTKERKIEWPVITVEEFLLK
jgi:hypothetical protein